MHVAERHMGRRHGEPGQARAGLVRPVGQGRVVRAHGLRRGRDGQFRRQGRRFVRARGVDDRDHGIGLAQRPD